MSGRAPARRAVTRLEQRKSIQKKSGRSVQTKQSLPASRVVVTVQDDPNTPGLANVQITRSVSRTPSSSSSLPSLSESLTQQLSSLLSSFFYSRTPAERLAQVAEEQKKLKQTAEAENEDASK